MAVLPGSLASSNTRSHEYSIARQSQLTYPDYDHMIVPLLPRPNVSRRNLPPV
jgi:hypothetical protein